MEDHVLPFKTKMKSIGLIPIIDDPSLIFRTTATTVVVEDNAKEKLTLLPKFFNCKLKAVVMKYFI